MAFTFLNIDSHFFFNVVEFEPHILLNNKKFWFNVVDTSRFSFAKDFYYHLQVEEQNSQEVKDAFLKHGYMEIPNNEQIDMMQLDHFWP